MQAYVLNDWSQDEKYYKMFNAEAKIRAFAESFDNTYHISIFACCRMLYNSKTMTDMIPIEEAMKHESF